MIRAALIYLSATMIALSQAPEALESYQWKHRLIIISSNDADSVSDAAQQLRELRDGVIDRDLKVIDISSEAHKKPNFIRPAHGSIGKIREFTGVDENTSQFILIGKDGGIKARQTGKLDLEKFFALIDTMPMRKREMR